MVPELPPVQRPFPLTVAVLGVLPFPSPLLFQRGQYASRSGQRGSGPRLLRGAGPGDLPHDRVRVVAVVPLPLVPVGVRLVVSRPPCAEVHRAYGHAAGLPVAGELPVPRPLLVAPLGLLSVPVGLFPRLGGAAQLHEGCDEPVHVLLLLAPPLFDGLVQPLAVGRLRVVLPEEREREGRGHRRAVLVVPVTQRVLWSLVVPLALPVPVARR